MTKLYTTIVLLYALFVAIYFLYLKVAKKRKKDIIGKGSSIQKTDNPKTDIVGKSRFEITVSKPLVSKSAPLPATTEKDTITPENAGNFAPSNGEKFSAEIPPEELDEAFSDTPADEENELTDIDYPLEYDTEEDEEETAEVEGAAQAALASGVPFEQFGNAVRTVNRNEEATTIEKDVAGNTLLELRQTDMFEQLVSGKPDAKEIVTSLMVESLAAFYRRKESEADKSGSGRKVPDNFDIQNFV